MTDNSAAMNHPNTSEEVEIDLVQAVRTLFRHIKAIILWTVLGAVLAAVVTRPVPPAYTANTLFYIDYMSVSKGTTAGTEYTTESRKLNAATSFLDTFGVLLTHDETLAQIVGQSGIGCTTEELAAMVSYEAVGGQMIRVTVTADSEQTAVSAARAVGEIMPEKLKDMVEGIEASVMEAGKLQPQPERGSNVLRNAVIGALAGMVASCGVILLLFVMDRHIYSTNYLAAAYPYVPLLTSLPDEKHAVGGAMEEAYKLLRTYLVFPSDGKQTRAIGVTSAVAGEGKTDVAVGLARVLAQAGKKVLLLEGNMRHPTMAQALELREGPDLAAQLAKNDAASAVTACSQGFDAAVCRSAPAEPSELVSSVQMYQAVEQARGKYDYVLVDLPAVMDAADAVAVSHMTDGMLVVVRAGRADMDSLAETMRRLAVADGRVLGFVFNGQEQTGKKR